MGSAAGRGVKDAIAEELLLRFGEEGLDGELLDEIEDFDDDVEAELEEEFGADDVDIDFDDDLDELLDEDSEDESFGFGGDVAAGSRVAEATQRRARQGGLGRILSEIGAGVVSSVAPPQLAHVFRPLASREPVSLQSEPSSVAGPGALPPVYVADVPGSAFVKSNADGSVSSDPILTPSSRFGASFERGFVRPRSTDSARQAAIACKLIGAREIGAAPRGTPRPFLEDTTAEPSLRSDGTIVESSYGEMICAPCPSCNQATRESYGATGNGCVVCDDWGGVLIPREDVSSWKAAPRYGFTASRVPSYGLFFLAPLAPLLGQAAAAGTQAAIAGRTSDRQDVSSRAQAVRERLKKQIEASKEKPPSDISAAPDSADDALDEVVEEAHDETFGLDELEVDDGFTFDFADDDIEDGFDLPNLDDQDDIDFDDDREEFDEIDDYLDDYLDDEMETDLDPGESTTDEGASEGVARVLIPHGAH